MSNNKQSSIEWYAEQSHELISKYIKGDISVGSFLISHHNLFYDAKARHRKEILEARQNGLDNGFINGSWDSQLYYDLEFGGNNEQ